MNQILPLWQRLIITVLVMLAASYLAAVLWNVVFGVALPSYLAGLVGGLAALPVWDLLQRIRSKG
jgi:Na+/glutamate symporter